MTKSDLREARRAYESLHRDAQTRLASNAHQQQSIALSYQTQCATLKSALDETLAERAELQRENEALSTDLSRLSAEHAALYEQHTALVVQQSERTMRMQEMEHQLHAQLQQAATLNSNNHNNAASQHETVLLHAKLNSASAVLLEQQDEIAALKHKLKQQQQTESHHKPKQSSISSNNNENASPSQAATRHSRSASSLAAEYSTARQLEEQRRTNAKHQHRIAELETQLAQQRASNLDTVQQQQQQQDASTAAAAAADDADEAALTEFQQSRSAIESRLDQLQNDSHRIAHILQEQKHQQQQQQRSQSANASQRRVNLPMDSITHLMHRFREESSHCGTMTSELVLQFLVSLNHIWKQRLQTRSRELMHGHQEKMSALRRQFQQQQPYEQVVQKARILRLQTQQDAARAITLHSHSMHAQQHELDLALASVESLTRQTQRLDADNRELQRALQHLKAHVSVTTCQRQETRIDTVERVVTLLQQLRARLIRHLAHSKDTLVLAGHKPYKNVSNVLRRIVLEHDATHLWLTRQFDTVQKRYEALPSELKTAESDHLKRATAEAEESNEMS